MHVEVLATQLGDLEAAQSEVDGEHDHQPFPRRCFCEQAVGGLFRRGARLALLGGLALLGDLSGWVLGDPVVGAGHGKEVDGDTEPAVRGRLPHRGGDMDHVAVEIIDGVGADGSIAEVSDCEADVLLVNTCSIREKAELLEFKKGNLDLVFRLPLEMINEVVGELEDAKKGGNRPYVMQISPALNVFFLGFQHQLEPFNNINVRKAFNYAIDREAIVTYTLQGEGRPAVNGFVPPFKGYDSESVRGYEFSPSKAKKHLAKAGFPNGKNFPEIALQINPGGGDRNIQVAEVVQKMLNENLGINIKIEQMQFAQHLESVETGKSLFWRSGWVADYPDPENFLNLLYGAHVPKEISEKAYINPMRYESSTFDSVFDIALRELNTAKRMELYRQLDQIVVDDAVTMPIFYDENTRLIQVHVKNFPSNSMEFRDLSEVYFDEEDL